MEIENKVREYGQKRNLRALQLFVSNTTLNKLTTFIHNRYNSPSFIHVWGYLMDSFNDSSESHKKRFEVISTLLHELEKGGLPHSQSNSLITRLCFELPKFKSNHLINICHYCVECIQKGNVNAMCWKEILPEILNILVRQEQVEYDERIMTGFEYKTELIKSLCMLVWSPSIVTSLASMFIDTPLTKEEHLQVVIKLGKYMEKLTCQEIPPFVYQLLKLCRYQNSRSIFLRLQYYFDTRIYSRINVIEDSSSESTNFDIIDDARHQEAIEVESTILFHFHQCASVGNENIKDYLASLKLMIKSPEFILHPFQLTVLLTISSIAPCKDQVLEILRLCISRVLNEEQKKLDTCWFRDMIPSTCKLEYILKQLIDSSIKNRHLVVQGLLQLAYVLLNSGAAIGKLAHLIASKQWELGTMIITKIISKKPQISPCVITELTTLAFNGSNVYPYAHILYILSRKMPAIMLDNQGSLTMILENIVDSNSSAAGQIFDAIFPLIKVSSTIRDLLILLLRKSLYSRQLETRQMAVTGFLKLIRSLKISNLAALSQSSSSGSMSSERSLLTQLTIAQTGQVSMSVFSNEALCLEVLNILRRCFLQQAEVRSQLYDGLFDAVTMNPELGIPVLDIVLMHFENFYIYDETIVPSLQFSKITIVKDIDVKLLEPLGKLIYTMGLIVTKVKEEIGSDNPTVKRLENILESLCKQMIKSELKNFDIEDASDLSGETPESQHKLFVLKEAVSICEALIGYKIHSWNLETQNNAEQVFGLFLAYSRLTDLAKSLTKQPKKKKKLDESTSQFNCSSDNKKNNIKILSSSSTLLDFQIVEKILYLLYKKEVDWTTPDQANILKPKQKFHQYILQVVNLLVDKLSHIKQEIRKTNKEFNYITKIAIILYEHCFLHLSELISFDSTTAVLAVECFKNIMTVVYDEYRNQFPLFLCTVAGKNEDEEPVNVLLIFLEAHEKLFELIADDVDTDLEIKKLTSLLISGINLLSSCASSENNAFSKRLLDWFKNYMNNNTLDDKSSVTDFINTAFNVFKKYRNTVSLFETVPLRLNNILGTISDDKPDVTEPKIIDENAALNVFSIYCLKVKTLIDDVDWIIARLRGEYAMISYPGEDNPERRREYLKSKERGVCCQLCSIITIIGTTCNIAISPGNLSEMLLKNVSHLYNTLNSLTKYFMMRSTKLNLVFQGAKFEQVVKLAGKQLSNVIYDYIIYIEEFNKQIQNTQSKKKTLNSDRLKSKILRETRLIPKVVYEIEQFGKSVIQLSNKTKVDLAKFVGQGTARDFRIKGLKEVLEQKQREIDSLSDTNINSDISRESENNTEIEDEVSANDDSEEEPPTKKSKV